MYWLDEYFQENFLIVQKEEKKELNCILSREILREVVPNKVVIVHFKLFYL
jgi:hypothetical protein